MKKVFNPNSGKSLKRMHKQNVSSLRAQAEREADFESPLQKRPTPTAPSVSYTINAQYKAN